MLARERILCSAMVFLWLANVPALAFNCNVNATGLAFGSYDVFSQVPTDTTGTISVDCNIPPQNPQAPLLVTISLSPGNSGNFAQRQMQSASAGTLLYNLYTTASFSTIWGDGGGSSSIQTGYVHRDMPWNATLFGRIPPRQNTGAGSYSDAITVTIDF